MKGLYDVWKWRLIQVTGENVEPTHVQRDVELAAPSLKKSPIKSVFVSILLFHGKCDWNSVVLGSWHAVRNDLNGYFVHLCAIQLTTQLTTLTIRPHGAHASCRWLSTRLQWHQCVCNGVTHGWPSTQPGTCTQPCPIVDTAVLPLFTQPCPGRTMSTALCIYVARLCASCPAV